MASKDPAKTDRQPLFMQQRSTDEYRPQPYTPKDVRVTRHTSSDLTDVSEDTGTPARLLAADRVGTAIGLRALNEEWGSEFYEVPEAAAREQASAEQLFSGPEIVVDVQTHFLPPGNQQLSDFFKVLYGRVMPAWWKEIDPVVSHDVAEYIMNVFLRTENAVAVLTTGAGDPVPGETRQSGGMLFNDEMAALRQLVDGMAGTGRLLNHAVVRANYAEDVAAMEYVAREYDPVGWKVYTMGPRKESGQAGGWRLDDEQYGLPFLERARLGVNLVCAHKGIAGFLDNGAPDDIGPAARAFPGIDFVVYHSGFEFPVGTFPSEHGQSGVPEGGSALGEEGPYTDELAHVGSNRLLRTVEEAGLGLNSNVYAELGTTWFSLVRRPREAAHLLGKLIAHLGEDHVIWGTDSIWYGAPQPLIDAFRAFQIPDDMCAQYGYAKLTPEVKAKVLGRNAARVYGIDLDKVSEQSKSDDLAWGRELIRTFESSGFNGFRS